VMHAYSEKYLHSATGILADMIDYAINDCGMESDMFAHMFVVSGASKEFERGNLRYVVGRSGIEIANEMIRKIKGEINLFFQRKKKVKALNIGRVGLWHNINGIRQNRLKIFSEAYRFPILSGCTRLCTKRIYQNFTVSRMK